jgi:hypothetical protein
LQRSRCRDAGLHDLSAAGEHDEELVHDVALVHDDHLVVDAEQDRAEEVSN